nr:uncharacterized protein LOC117224556 [Megalopta genalis]
MKILVVVAVVFAAVMVKADVADLYLDLVKDPITHCAKENGFTEQTPREIFDKDLKSGLDGSTCLLACTMKRMGTIKDSKLNQENLIAFVKEAHSKNPEKIPVLEKAVAECMEKVKSMPDECKMAFSYVQCFLDKH